MVRTKRSAKAFALGARTRGADHPGTLGAEDIIERLSERVRKIELRADPFNDATWDRETSGIVLS